MSAPEIVEAVSLWQPWASLLVLGRKRFETRSFGLPKRLHGKRVLIHAAKRPIDMLDDSGEVCLALGIPVSSFPLGCFVGSVLFLDSYRIGALIPGREEEGECWGVLELCERLLPAGVDPYAENFLGNFGPLRCAWLAAEGLALTRPVPYRGQQGFFRADADATRAVLAGPFV